MISVPSVSGCIGWPERRPGNSQLASKVITDVLLARGGPKRRISGRTGSSSGQMRRTQADPIPRRRRTGRRLCRCSTPRRPTPRSLAAAMAAHLQFVLRRLWRQPHRRPSLHAKNAKHLVDQRNPESISKRRAHAVWQRGVFTPNNVDDEPFGARSMGLNCLFVPGGGVGARPSRPVGLRCSRRRGLSR